MSYILEQNNQLILAKLTAKGREQIANGKLNFKYFALGDSELDYGYITPETPKILRPKDFNPPLKTFLEGSGCTKLVELQNTRVQECCIRDAALERGFFSGETLAYDMNYEIKIPNYIRTSGIVNLTDLNGTDQLDLGVFDFEDGDFLLLKITNSLTGVLPLDAVGTPIPYLWFKIEKNPSSSLVTLDRNLPNFANWVNVDVEFIVYPNNNSIETFYGSGQTTPYWNSETLEFLFNCDVSQYDVPVWNMNNVWNENLAGVQNGYETFEDYGSIEYVGQKEYLGYNLPCENPRTFAQCQDKLLGYQDEYIKGISILHYTNNNPSNEYGERFYIDEEHPFFVDLPSIMYHRRYFSGTTIELGMSFMSSGQTKYVENSQIPYVELIENPNFIASGDTPLVVGRVFPTLKIATFHDAEILSVLSYKSNRNWTLPRLKGTLVYPANGLNTGVLPRGKTLYLTYVLEANDGVQYTLPMQQYLKFNNTSIIDRDVQFNLEDIGLLRYMRHIENLSYDGQGFYAHTFKVLVQIVDNSTDRPNPQNWKVIDLTSPAITRVASYSIDPLLLETNIFGFTKQQYDAAPFYDLSIIGIPAVCCPDILNFGDEEFFWGNIRTHIGACIYRTVFRLDIENDLYIKTNNPTYFNSEKYFSEIGIYNADQELVAISKLSRPFPLRNGRRLGIEITLDF